MSTAKIGLALGGGAARGIAHIAMLEAFDELKLRPSVIAGTSAGALFGAAYASGMSAAEIRSHTETLLASRRSAIRRILDQQNGSGLNLFNFNVLRSAPFNGAELVRIAFPGGTARRLEECEIPFLVVATDFYSGQEVVMTSGDLFDAVAASIAIPGAISAPNKDGRILIDGAISNPVPYDIIRDDCDVTVAIDVTGLPSSAGRDAPSPAMLLSGTMQIQQKTITRLKCEAHPPDILIVPDVDAFRVHDFFRVAEILKAAQPAKNALLRKLESLLGSSA